jgi:hypothetical protein
MLEFTLNNEPFALDRGRSVRLNWRNPACNFTEFPGDVGMGIELPVNDINKALLGNPERFERYAEENIREFSRFEIRYGGVLLMGGTLIIQTANNESYSGWLRSDIGNLGKEHREKYIYDSISFLQEKTFENKADYDPLTDDYGCPTIYNPKFFYDKGRKIQTTREERNPNYVPGLEYLGWLVTNNDKYISVDDETEDLTYAFKKTADHLVNAQNEDGTIKTSTSSTQVILIPIRLDVYVVSPMLFLNYILKTIFKDAGFYLDENFIAEDRNLKKLILYNNYDITRMTFTPKAVEKEKYWYDGQLLQAAYRLVDGVTRDYLGKFYYKDLLPQIKLKDFLLSVQNLLNVCFYFRAGRKIVDIIDRESIITGYSIDIEEYLMGFWEMNNKKDITLKFTFEHDDADIIFQERWENIDDCRIDEGEPVETWSDLAGIEEPKLGEIRYIKEKNIYVQYNLLQEEEQDYETEQQLQSNSIGWEQITMGFQNGFYNKGKEEKEEIATKFSTLFCRDQDVFAYQFGNIQSIKYTYENFSPRLLFYLGNNKASFETLSLSLDWEKENTNLLLKRWKHWNRFWTTRQPIICEAHFPLNMIDYVLRNIYKKFRTREGEFIIEEMETEFSINQVGITKIKGYKLNYSPNIYQLADLWTIGERVWLDQRIISGSINPFL